MDYSLVVHVQLAVEDNLDSQENRTVLGGEIAAALPCSEQLPPYEACNRNEKPSEQTDSHPFDRVCSGQASRQSEPGKNKISRRVKRKAKIDNAKAQQRKAKARESDNKTVEIGTQANNQECQQD